VEERGSVGPGFKGKDKVEGYVLEQGHDHQVDAARLLRMGGGPGRSRTADKQFRKLLLYPSELRGHAFLQAEFTPALAVAEPATGELDTRAVNSEVVKSAHGFPGRVHRHDRRWRCRAILFPILKAKGQGQLLAVTQLHLHHTGQPAKPSAPNPAPALPPGPAPVAGNMPGLPGPPANFFLLTQSVTIQNFGHESADWIEIVHARRPDFFQLHPALNYTESTAQTGEHTLRVGSLASKEFFTIQFLCYTHMPTLAYIRSPAGHASPMPWMTVRKYPSWVYAAMWLAMLVGAGFVAYWIIKGGTFVLKSVGALGS
jgi:hypothetical protein